MNNLFNEFRNEFLNFINEPNIEFPEIFAKEAKEDCREQTLAYVDRIELYNPVVNIYYNKNLTSCVFQYQKALIFHELTHIYDGRIAFPGKKDQELAPILALYSEYHASQIEIMCNLGFKSINDFLKIDINNTNIAHKDQIIHLSTGLLSPLIGAYSIVNHSREEYYYYTKQDYYNVYHDFESRTMYYIGKISICQKYGYPLISDSIQKYYPDYAPCIYEIWGAIENKEFEKLNDLRNQLWNRFKEHFDCEAKLPDEL